MTDFLIKIAICVKLPFYTNLKTIYGQLLALGIFEWLQQFLNENVCIQSLDHPDLPFLILVGLVSFLFNENQTKIDRGEFRNYCCTYYIT